MISTDRRTYLIELNASEGDLDAPAISWPIRPRPDAPRVALTTPRIPASAMPPQSSLRPSRLTARPGGRSRSSTTGAGAYVVFPRGIAQGGCR